MDIIPAVAAAQEFVKAHPIADMMAAFAAGMAAANPIKCADYSCAVINHIPPLKYVVRANWPAISDFIDRFQERFGTEVQEQAVPAPDAAKAPKP